VGAGLSADTRPFCAHITLGKSKDTERMTTQQRRTLRGFGKWMQDQERPLHLQQLLEGEASRGGGRGQRSLDKGGSVGGGQRRGNKRHNSWIAGGGKGGAALGWAGGGKGGRERDLGTLNAELAAELGASGLGGDVFNIGVEVDSVHVMEAVREPGSKYVGYETLMAIPLGRGAAAPSPAPAPQAAPAPNAAAKDTGFDYGSSYYVTSTPSSLTPSEQASLAELLEDSDLSE